MATCTQSNKSTQARTGKRAPHIRAPALVGSFSAENLLPASAVARVSSRTKLFSVPAPCSPAARVKSRLGYLAAFLAGAAVVVIGAALLDQENPSPPDAPLVPMSANAPTEDAAVPLLSDPPVNAPRPLLSADFACHPRPGESARDEFRRILRELVQAPIQERQARLALLLARIRERAPTSISAVMEYLRDGRNLSSSELFGEAGFLGGGSHYKDLRSFLYLTLAQIAEAHPEVRAQIATEGLEHARRLQEALPLADAAAAHPGTRQQAIEAIKALMDENGLFSETHEVMRAMVRLESEELIPLLADFLERHPYHVTVEGFLAALWNFPDEIRATMAARLAGSAAVREKMRPESWQWLDMRDPSLRGVIVQDFRATAADESDNALHARFTLLQKLGETRDAAQSRYHKFPIGSATPRSGAPDSREQMIARLVLLDELAPFCRAPILESHRQEACARLLARLAQP
jgi:hypothetical protein